MNGPAPQPSATDPTAPPSGANTDAHDVDWSPGDRDPLWWRSIRLIVQLGLATAIVFGAVIMARGFTSDRPQTRRGPPEERTAQLVEVVTVWPGDEQVVVEASGHVIPARTVHLHPRVTGEVVELHDRFRPGGLIGADDVVVRIDDDDYELAERQAEAQLAAAEAEQRIELGNQEIARNEFELYGDSGPEELDELGRALVLRQPQLDSANAAIESADAAVDQARLALRRTRVRAPFDAIVQTRGVDIGSPVSPSTPIAELVGTDTFWIEAAVPVDELRWFDVPRRPGDSGATVTIRHQSAWGPGVTRSGRVIQLRPGLEEGGRLARLLVAVDDPLSLAPDNGDQPPLFLDAWVEIEIGGQTLGNVIAVPAGFVRDGQYAWVMNDDDRLEVRELDIIFRRRDNVLVSGGIEAGERVIATNLTAPVEGMMLRVERPPEDESTMAPSADRRPDGEAADEPEARQQ